MQLTLFQLRGGHFGPERPKAVSHFHSFMTRVTKIHDFVYFSIPLVPVKPFLKKEIWNFKKLKKENLLFWHQRVPALKKNWKKYSKRWFSFQKFLIFQLQYEFYTFEAFFELHNISFDQILRFSFFLAIRFPLMTSSIPCPIAAKIVIKGDCFWYIWTAKDQNIYLRSYLRYWDVFG